LKFNVLFITQSVTSQSDSVSGWFFGLGFEGKSRKVIFVRFKLFPVDQNSHEKPGETSKFCSQTGIWIVYTE